MPSSTQPSTVHDTLQCLSAFKVSSTIAMVGVDESSLQVNSLPKLVEGRQLLGTFMILHSSVEMNEPQRLSQVLLLLLLLFFK